MAHTFDQFVQLLTQVNYLVLQNMVQLTDTYLTDTLSKFQKLSLLILKSFVQINRHFPKKGKNRGVC